MSSGAFIDAILEKFSIANDAKLAGFLGFDPSVISKIRTRRLGISNAFILALHEFSDMPIAELKALREKFQSLNHTDGGINGDKEAGSESSGEEGCSFTRTEDNSGSTTS